MCHLRIAVLKSSPSNASTKSLDFTKSKFKLRSEHNGTNESSDHFGQVHNVNRPPLSAREHYIVSPVPPPKFHSSTPSLACRPITVRHVSPPWLEIGARDLPLQTSPLSANWPFHLNLPFLETASWKCSSISSSPLDKNILVTEFTMTHLSHNKP